VVYTIATSDTLPDFVWLINRRAEWCRRRPLVIIWRAVDFSVETPTDVQPRYSYLTCQMSFLSCRFHRKIENRSLMRFSVGTVAMIIAEGLFSMAFFWLRNTIMFIEGPTMHSVEVLRKTAQEFERLHWWRVAFNLIARPQSSRGLFHLSRRDRAETGIAR